MPENWHTWYLGEVDSDSGLRFLKFRLQNQFLGKFGPKKSKLSVLLGNWHTWYLGEADSDSGLRFLKFRPQNPFLGEFGPKKSKLSVLPENWHTRYLEDADFYSHISFSNFQLEIHFSIELGPGSGIACFVWCWYIWRIGVADLFQLKSVTGEDKEEGL